MDEKKFKLAYFFFFIGSERLTLTDINKPTLGQTNLSFFKKPKKQKTKHILRHNKRRLSNAIIVSCTKICVKE